MGRIYDMATRAAQNNVISVQEMGEMLGKALENGKLDRGEKSDLQKIQRELGPNLTGPARMALSRFLGLGDAFKPNLAGQIFGVDQNLGEQFEKAGVMDPVQLLGRAQRPKDRSDLADSFGISIRKMADLAQRADLARVTGVGTKYAAALERVGVRNVQQLANADVNTLHRQIRDFAATPKGKELITRRPSKGAVERWINNAAALPFMLFHANESGQPFSAWAFKQLENHQQAQLLWGADVKLPGGKGIFDADGLKTSRVRVDRGLPNDLPAAMRQLLMRLEANPPEHPDYDGPSSHAEVAGIKEIKLGDKTLGYTAIVEVQSDHGYEYEGMPVDDYGTFELKLAFDNQGKKLDEDVVYW